MTSVAPVAGTSAVAGGNAGSYQIFIKALTGRNITLDVTAASTIESVKQQVSAREGIPVGEIRLVGFGKELENARTLSDYNINRDATLHLVLSTEDISTVLTAA